MPLFQPKSYLNFFKRCVSGQPALLQRNPLVPDKIELINYAFSRFGLHSFADLGGVWGVEGGYTFNTLDNHDVSAAILVDTNPTDMVENRAREFAQLKILTGNFGDEAVAATVGDVDAVFLFDVLLHQVAPDWHRVLEMYARQTKCFVIYNQQWTGSDQTVRLLDFGEEEYFRNVPHERTETPYDNLFEKLDEKHSGHGRLWRDVHSIWQWGITNSDLITKVESLGFRLQYMKNCGRFGQLENFENHAFVFTK
jgi:hypothetical protein